MKKPLEFCLRHLRNENHDELEDVIRDRAARLEHFDDGVVGCHVTVDRPQLGPENKNDYRVLIRLTVPPNKELVVTHHPLDLHGSAAEVIEAAFDLMEQQLDTYADIRRGDVKAHTREAR